MKALESLWHNADKSAVFPDGHPEAAFLWAAPGDEIPDEAAERFDVVDGRAPGSAEPEPAPKEKKPGGDKEKKPEGDKAGSGKGGLTVNKRARRGK